MDNVVERVMSTFGMMRSLDEVTLAGARQRLTGYIEKLTAGGQSDPLDLAVYGLAYLREWQDGPGTRFSGC